MFEKLKQLFQRQPKLEAVVEKEKPVIITIHGYGRRRQHEFDNFVNWGKQDGFEIIQFDMYDLFDETDNNWMEWVGRAKQQLDVYKDRTVYLVGFSMGGVIASYLANVCNIDRLILLAPAFQYIHMEHIPSLLTKGASVLLGNDKKDKDEIEIPASFYGTFTELIKQLKKYIATVDCPVLFIHGDEDEVISLKSSLSAYEKVFHDKKKLFILHEGHHRLLMDEKVNWECYQIMKLFLQDQIITCPQPKQAEDILEIMKRERKQKETIQS